MTEEEYEKVQRERALYRQTMTERHNKLVRESVRLKNEQALNNYRLCNPTKTDKELKLNQTILGSDMILKNYDYVTNVQKRKKSSNNLFKRIKKIIKDNFTFDC